jgi:hypothetical protein
MIDFAENVLHCYLLQLHHDFGYFAAASNAIANVHMNAVGGCSIGNGFGSQPFGKNVGIVCSCVSNAGEFIDAENFICIVHALFIKSCAICVLMRRLMALTCIVLWPMYLTRLDAL